MFNTDSHKSISRKLHKHTNNRYGKGCLMHVSIDS